MSTLQGAFIFIDIRHDGVVIFWVPPIGFGVSKLCKATKVTNAYSRGHGWQVVSNSVRRNTW